MMRSSKRRYLFVFGIIFLILISVAVVIWFWKKERLSKVSRPVRYNDFGIYIPPGYMIHGIDVSRYQGPIDWRAVAAMNIKSIRMEFAFIRATQGVSYTDPYFEQNWQDIAQTQLIRGAYHFFEPTMNGQMQADHFIRQVELRTGDLPPVLDIETIEGSNPQQLVVEVRRWLDRVERHYGVKPIIYSGADFYRRYLANHFSNYTLWVAHYDQPRAPRVYSNWKIWQHSKRGRVNGIDAWVDFNVLNGSRAALDSLRISRTIR